MQSEVHPVGPNFPWWLKHKRIYSFLLFSFGTTTWMKFKVIVCAQHQVLMMVSLRTKEEIDVMIMWNSIRARWAQLLFCGIILVVLFSSMWVTSSVLSFSTLIAFQKRSWLSLVLLTLSFSLNCHNDKGVHHGNPGAYEATRRKWILVSTTSFLPWFASSSLRMMVWVSAAVGW